MTLKLAEVVPWGRSCDDYRRMFALHDTDCEKRILGCADGPASFNAEMTSRGRVIVSCDPIYAFSAGQIRKQIDATYALMVEQTKQNASAFVWTTEMPHAEALGRIRLAAMTRFLADYPLGVEQGRYVADQLPNLGFQDQSFDIAVCSHFLFLYGKQLSRRFHLQSIRCLLRVAAEVRIFPLLELAGKLSCHVQPVINFLRSAGYRVEIEEVAYQVQRGGNKMMKIRH